jgi:hypothetical protein
MVSDGQWIQFAQILNTIADDEAMVNAAQQLQKRCKRVRRNLVPSTEPEVRPTNAVNDAVSISPKAHSTGDQPSKSKSYRTNDNPTNSTCESMPGLMRPRLALEM